MTITSKTFVKSSAHAALKLRVDAAETNINSLDGRLDTAETALTGLDGRLDSAETNIAGHETRLDSLDALVESNNTALDGRVDTLEQEYDQHEIRLDQLDIDQGVQNNTLSNHDSRITHIEQILEASGQLSVRVSMTSGSLANNATENLNVTVLGRKCSLYAAEWGAISGTWWIRAYHTAAARTADVGRSSSVDPTHLGACQWELLLESSMVSPEPLDSTLKNLDTPRAAIQYLSITNLSGSTGTLSLTLEAMIEEA